MGEKKRLRSENLKQLEHRSDVKDAVRGMIEQDNFDRLVRKGIIKEIQDDIKVEVKVLYE